jgi:predicted nucleotidyltransferase
MNSLSHNILSTIAYYDVLDYPMTSFEIWKYLVGKNEDKQNFSLAEVVDSLESNDDLKKNVEQFRGFFFLSGRKELALGRLKRNKIFERKFRLIEKIVKVLRFVPYVRMIAVTGRVAMKNAEAKSDLDFLIALQKGKIFTGRILVTMLTHFLGKRRYGRKITDRACLNFFLTDGSLEIDLKDIYSSSEYSFMFPVFGGETFSKFQKENFWIRKFRPNFFPDEAKSAKMLGDTFFSSRVRKIGERLFSFDFFEKFFKKWQMKRIVNDPRTYKKGSGVMASDQALIFLPDPHGPEIFEKYQRKMESLS